MKTTRKTVSLLGGLMVAFAITLFLPSIANAKGHGSHGSNDHCSWNNHGSHGSKGKNSHGSHGSWGNHGSHGSKSKHGSHGSKGKNSHGSHGSWGNHGSHGSKGKNSHGSHGSNNHGSTCDTATYNRYKALAAKYLRAYYRCYNYKYYRYYVYYMKKANTCKPKPAVDNCTKYKNLADKYLAAYNRCGYYCYYQYYLYYMNLYNKCQINTVQTGKICGLVFEDSNDNGTYDKSDKRLENVTITITDAKGKTHTVKTNKWGFYCATSIPAGEATVDIDENTLPANPTQVVGTDPTTVNVKANTKNWEERNGYTFPVPTGNVCGVVYEDTNNNKQQDNGEKGAEGIKVTIIDANGDTHVVTTDATGKYCLKNVVEGSATIEIDETSLPKNGQLTAGDNPNTITVEANTNNDAGKDGYTLPVPTGNLCGIVMLEDENGQETPLAGVSVIITDSEGNTREVITDNNGKYCAKNLPQGSTTVDIDETTLPANVEYSYGNGDPSDHNVIADKDNNAGKDVYVVPTPIGNVCGKVIVDGNGQSGVTLNITDRNGDIHPVITSADGSWCAKNIPAGTVIVDVDEATLPANVKRVLGEDQDTYTVQAGENTDAGIDGYNSVPTGTVCGQVFVDVANTGHIFKNTPGISNITVKITDSLGNIHTGETDTNGNYCISDVAEGIATVDIDENDPDMPENAFDTTHRDPSQVTVIANQTNNAGTDGYYDPNTTLGKVFGFVHLDSNHNGVYDRTDEPIVDATVTVIDSEGNTHTMQTYSNGGFAMAVPAGMTTIKINPNDPKLTHIYGAYPQTLNVNAGEKTYFGRDGYTSVPMP